MKDNEILITALQLHKREIDAMNEHLTNLTRDMAVAIGSLGAAVGLRMKVDPEAGVVRWEPIQPDEEETASSEEK